MSVRETDSDSNSDISSSVEDTLPSPSIDSLNALPDQKGIEDETSVDNTNTISSTEPSMPTEAKNEHIDATEAKPSIVVAGLAPAMSPPAPATSKPMDVMPPRTSPPSVWQRIRRRRISPVLLAILLLGILIPTILAVSYGIRGYMTYTALHDEAYSGVQHFLNIKTLFTGGKTHTSGFLDVTKLHRAQQEFTAARQDFQHVRNTLDQSDIISTVTTYLPQYRSQITSVRALSQMGIDAADIGQELVQTALILAPTFRGPLLTDSHEPLVTPAMITLLRATIDKILPHVQNIQAQSGQVSIQNLPVSSDKQNQLVQLLQLIPQAHTDLLQVRDLLDAGGWILGVNEPRTFLVQTMDRAELRPTGGFTGQYGELSINAGRVLPFSLKDISGVEYIDNSATYGQQAPAQYRSWWPFENWGLRDSNLSADFPTSAQLAIAQYQHEVKHQVDGVILFTPILIEHVIQVIGPISIPSYHEVITSDNLEERLHYYQQDNAGIRKQEVTQHVSDPAAARKLFTATLAHTLLDQVRHAPPDEIIAIARQMLRDLKTKDIQIYVTNSQIEGLLARYGDAAQLDRSTTHDGLYVVQANVSASKASQYVRTSIHDVVSLNASGGATHSMQLRLVYNQIGPVYGLDTYRDYVRIYVPPTSKFLGGDGFDTGVPLCNGGYAACPQYDVYPHGELLCPAGQFQPGASAPMIGDPFQGRFHPLDTVGPPTNLSSDEAGRAMYGGWVIVPKNCTATVTLSWYVPPVGHTPYTLLVQRQAGTFPELDVTILPPPGNCAIQQSAGLYFNNILSEDISFTPQRMDRKKQQTMSCYPQSGV